MATLINGNGNPAVYAGQDADLYAGTIGAATRILNVGSRFAATIEDSNTVAIADGVIVTKEGRRIQLDVGSIDEFSIPTGQAGTTRYYIIGYHLYTDGSANQLCETFVQLMSSATETITENTFRGGFNEVYVSLYRVTQNGLTLKTPAALLSVTETIAQLRDKVNPAMQDILWYGTCTTAAATQAKVATTTDRKLANLAAGQKVAIKMTNNNTHATPTLNVDGKGAKSIKAYGTTAPTVWWKAGDVVTFVYDGTNWIMGVAAGEIEQINQNLTEFLRYNPDTDMIQIMVGGVWTDWKKAYMQNYMVYADGEFLNGFDLGGNTTANNTTQYGGATYSDNQLSITIPGSTSAGARLRGSIISPKLDFTNYTSLVIEYTANGTNQSCTLDVSSVSGEYYIAITGIIETSQASGYSNVYVCSSTSVSANVGSHVLATGIPSNSAIVFNTIYVS